MSANRYYDTLWQVFDAISDQLKENRASSSEFDNFLHTGGISYGESQSFDFDLERYQGKFAKKDFCFHVTIERSSNNGLYSFVGYFL